MPCEPARERVLLRGRLTEGEATGWPEGSGTTRWRIRRPWPWSIRTAPSGARARWRCAATAWSTGCGRSVSSPATRSRRCSPTGSTRSRSTWARSSRGSTTCRSTTGSPRPEIAYILKDSDAKAFVTHERYAEDRHRSRRRGRDPRRRPVRSRRRPGLPGLRRLARRAAQQRPGGPHRGCRDALHVGDHRSPQGREALALRAGRRSRRGALHRVLRFVRHPAAGQQRAPLHVAELPHRGHDVRRQRAELGSRGRLHGQVGSRADAGEDRAVPLHAHPHGADAVQPDAAAPG